MSAVKRHWKALAWGGVCLAMLLALLILWRQDRRTIAALTPQQTAQRWQTPDKPYAMASVFLPSEGSIDPARMGEIRLAIQRALISGGVGPEDHPWLYCASYQQEATLQNGKASCPVELTAVTGDFFHIHPLPVLSGWYFSAEDVMHDRIVLDRQTAWNLFYSADVAGQFVTLNGVQYEVAAVVEPEAGRFTALAAGKTCRAWVLADAPGLSAAEPAPAAAPADTPSAPGAQAQSPGYTCLEVVLPQPVKDFAASTLRAALGSMIQDSTPIVDNSGRFSLKNRWAVLRALSTWGIAAEGIAYPYWENAARLTEEHLARRLIPEGILLGIPSISLLVLLIWLNHRRRWGLHSLRDAAENAIDRRHQRAYDRRQALKNRPTIQEKRESK